MKKIFIFGLLAVTLTGLFFSTVLVDQPVFFADKSFENVVRGMLNHSGKPIYESQLLSIIELDLNNLEISDLTGIEQFRNLEVLNLYENEISDVSQLETLNSLKALNLGRNQLVDLHLANFDKLIHLDLRYLNLDENFIINENKRVVRLSDIQLVENFTSLEELSVVNNDIVEFSPRYQFNHLHTLDMSHNQIGDIEFIERMPTLRYLNLRDNEIQDISVLSELVDIKYLNLHSNPDIDSIKPITPLINLEKLILRDVPIKDDVVILRNFPRLTYLNVRNCSISDYQVLADMMANGIIQNDAENDVLAFVNIRDNVLTADKGDPLSSLRPYWENIAFRNPYQLPPIATRKDPPQFSHFGGYATEAFDLGLSSGNPSDLILYTLDGSDPKIENVDTPPSQYQKTYLYSEPISIKSRVGEDNFFSMIQTAYIGRGWLPRWNPPKGEVFKATVVRAVSVDPVTLSQSDIITKTFFVDEGVFERYSTLPVISLVGDYQFLFDQDEGIYITDIGVYPQRLNRSRVPANIEFFEPSGDLGFQGRIEIALQGATSPASPQKGLHVFSGYWSSGEPYISYPLFKNSESKANQLIEFERFILRAWGSARGWPIFFADAYNQTLMAESDQDIQAYQPVIVFINGEYWGLHEMREANKNSWYYQAHYFDGQNMDFDLLDWGGEIVDEGDSAQWDDLMDFIESNDMSSMENYAYVKSQVDVDNFVEYMIHCIYTGKIDWPGQNEYVWRPKTEDGKWRWAQYDMDQGMSPWAGPDFDVFPQIFRGGEREHFLFNALLQNSEFRALFINTFADLMNTYFLTEVELEHFNNLVRELEPYITEFQDRWQLNEGWEENINFALELINRRWDLRRQQVISNFDLSGSSIITINTDSSMGVIRINSIVVDHNLPGVSDSSYWQGMYFHGIPIQIEAIPLPGYRFVGWESTLEIEPSGKEFTVFLEKDSVLTAVFEREHE